MAEQERRRDGPRAVTLDWADHIVYCLRSGCTWDEQSMRLEAARVIERLVRRLRKRRGHATRGKGE